MTTRIRQMTGIRKREFFTFSAKVIGASGLGVKSFETKDMIAT